MQNKTVYKIDHFYVIDHEEFSFFVESTMNPTEMIYALLTMQFMHEELVDESTNIHPSTMTELLERHYSVENVTHRYKKYLPFMKISEEDWEMLIEFILFDEELDENIRIIQIDLYSSREVCCGEMYQKLINNKIVQNKEYQETIKNGEAYI